MATLEQRIDALEKHTLPSNSNIHVVFCQGEEHTQDERAKAGQYEHTIMVSFVEAKVR